MFFVLPGLLHLLFPPKRIAVFRMRQEGGNEFFGKLIVTGPYGGLVDIGYTEAKKKFPYCHCENCDYTWTSKKAGMLPAKCPSCNKKAWWIKERE